MMISIFEELLSKYIMIAQMTRPHLGSRLVIASYGSAAVLCPVRSDTRVELTQ